MHKGKKLRWKENIYIAGGVDIEKGFGVMKKFDPNIGIEEKGGNWKDLKSPFWEM